MHSRSLEWLAESLRRCFAHVGPRQAKRMALQLLQLDENRHSEFLTALKTAREKISRCRVCQDLAESELCPVCRDASRDPGIVAIVENPQDVSVMEGAKNFRGLYHVLHGGVDPSFESRGGSWTFPALMERLASPSPSVREVILALDHDSDGELTSLYLAGQIRSEFPHIRLTRIGVGIPFGGEILYSDPATLKRAIAARTAVEKPLAETKKEALQN